MRGHEVDRLGRRELRRDREIALVLAVGVVDDDDELALADVLDRLLDRRERALLGRGSRCRSYRATRAAAPRRSSATSSTISRPPRTSPQTDAEHVVEPRVARRPRCARSRRPRGPAAPRSGRRSPVSVEQDVGAVVGLDRAAAGAGSQLPSARRRARFAAAEAAARRGPRAAALGDQQPLVAGVARLGVAEREPVERLEPHRGSSRSTYFASTSTSRLTSSPGSSAPSVVTASVCGTSATAKPSSSSAAT